MNSTTAKSITNQANCSVPASEQNEIMQHYFATIETIESDNFHYLGQDEFTDQLLNQAKDKFLSFLIHKKIKELEYTDQMDGWSRTIQNEYLDRNAEVKTNSNIFAGLKNFINNPTINHVHKIDNTSVDSALNRGADKVKDTVQKVKEEVANSFLPSLDNVKKWTTPMAVVAFLVAAVQWYREGRFAKELLIGAITLLLPEAYSLAKPYILAIWKALTTASDEDAKKKGGGKKEENKDSEGYVDQWSMPSFKNFTLCPSSIKILSGAIAALTLSWLIKDARTLKDTIERIIKLKDFPNMSNGIFSIIEWFMTSLETIINYVRGLFGKDKWFFWSSDYVEVEKLIREAYAALSKYNRKDRLVLWDVQYIDRLYAKLEHEEMTLPKKANRELILITNLKRAMMPLMQRVRRCNVQGAGSRLAPVSIMFSGESAIGKSNCQIAFAKAIAARLLSEERLETFRAAPETEIYAYNEADDFWEGYEGQFIVWHDDIGHMKTVPGQNSAESSVIPEKNEIPYPLNRAFEQKGKSFYISEVMLATSNFVKFVPENLAYPEAFTNRWDMSYVLSVDPKSEWCANPHETNPMKRVLKKRNDDKIAHKWKYMQFIKFDIRGFHAAQNRTKKGSEDPSLSNYLGEILNFDEMVEEFIFQYNKHKKRGLKLLSMHNDVVKEQLELRKKYPPIAFDVELEKTNTIRTPLPGEFNDQAEDIADVKEVVDPEKEEVDKSKLFESMINKFKDGDTTTMDFAAGLHYYGSHHLDGNDYRAYRGREPTEGELRKLRNFTREMNLKRSNGRISVMGSDNHLAELLNINHEFKWDFCPIATGDCKVVTEPSFLKSAEAKIAYYTGYCEGLITDVDSCQKQMATLPSGLLSTYPSLYNPLFVDHIKALGVDLNNPAEANILGRVVGCLAKLMNWYSRRLCVRTKRAFKQTMCNLYGISKENLKAMLSGSWLKELFVDAIKFGAIGIGIILTAGYLTKGLNKLNIFPIFEEEPKSKDQSNSFINLKEAKQSKRDRIVNRMTNQIGTYNLIHDSAVLDIAKTVRNGNVYLIHTSDGVMLGSMLFIKAYIAIMPLHFRIKLLRAVEKGEIGENAPIKCSPWRTKIVDGNAIGGFSFVPSTKNLLLPKGKLKDMDVCFFNAEGTGKQPVTSVTKYFYREEDLDEECISFRGSLFKTKACNEVEIETFDLKMRDGVVTNSGLKLNKYQWSYKGNTTNGHCGSLIAIHDISSGARKFVGFHTSGRDDGMGAGALIFQEELEFELAHLNVVYETEMDYDIQCYADESGELNHRKLWDEKCVPMPTRSKICKAPLFGLITEPTKKPVKMVSWTNEQGVTADPVQVSLSKQKSENVYINNELVTLTCGQYFRYCQTVSPMETTGTGRIYSVEEACAGIPGDKYIRGIPRKTSPGHPYNLVSMRKGGGKYLWFGRQADYDFSNEHFKKLKARCHQIIHRSNEGFRYTFIFYAFPKDETLKKEKIDEEFKLRMIMGSPMDHVITGRMLNLECFKWIMTNRIDNWMAIGMDEHSQEWHHLGVKLRGEYLIDGDHKAFDTKNKTVFISTHTSFTNMYYQDENKKAREIIDLELTNSKLVFKNSVYEKTDGLASGAYPTIFTNGHSNINLILHCVHKIMFGTTQIKNKEMSRELIFRFLKECSGIVQGDDFVLSIRGSFVGKITFNTLRETMALYGYEITPSTKQSGPAPDYTPFSKITFLKRTFVDHNGRYIGPLEMESIDNMLQWVNKKNFDLQDYFLVLETYLSELSLHGGEKWWPKFKKLIKACQTLRIPFIPKFQTQADYFENTLDIGYENTDPVLDTEWDLKNEEAPHIIDDAKSDPPTPPENLNVEVEDATFENCKKLWQVVAEELKTTDLTPISDSEYEDQINMRPNYFRGVDDSTYQETLNLVNQDRNAFRPEEYRSFVRNAEAVIDRGGDYTDPDQNHELMYFDQMNNMTSTTAKSINENSTANDSERIVQKTTAIDSSTSDLEKYTNNALEESLRRIILKQSDVADFLGKKYELGTTTWATTDPINTNLFTIDIDFYLQSRAVFADKISGFLNFRANAVITVELNASPFQSGIFRLEWKPYATNDPDWRDIDLMHTRSLIQRSQLPGVFHNIRTNTCSLSVPLIGPQNSKTLDGSVTSWSFGLVDITTYTALLSGAADTLTMRMFISFEDVEIDTPYKNQMGVMSGKKPENEERKEKGIVTRTSGTITKVLSTLDQIPGIQSVTGPALWLSKLINGTADAFGWSKPNVDQTMNRVTSNIMYYGPNFNGADASVKLSLDATSAVSAVSRATINPGDDEMSISFIKSQWSYFTEFAYTYDAAAGANLLTLEHRPSAYTGTVSIPMTAGGSTTVYLMTPVCYLANLFDNWCGDLEFKIMFNKTGFHTGAISFTYVPTRTALGITYLNNVYNLREILDIQTCDEFCFRMPYCLPDPYLPYLTPSGYLKIEVVTPLKAVGNVADHITGVVLVRGAPNMDFQVPRNKLPFALYYDQGGDITNEGCVEGSEIGLQPVNYNVAKSALCVGENITSTKQLLSKLRFAKFKSGTLAGVTFKTIFIPPLWHGVTYYKKTAGTYAQAATMGESDFISTHAMCYQFVRGSMRYAASTATTSLKGFITDKIPSNITQTNWFSANDEVLNSTLDPLQLINGAFVSNPYEETCIVTDPYYNKYPVTVIRPSYTNTQSWSTKFGPNHSIGFSSTALLQFFDGSFILQRAAGEDYQLSFWLGVPPLLVP